MAIRFSSRKFDWVIATVLVGLFSTLCVIFYTHQEWFCTGICGLMAVFSILLYATEWYEQEPVKDES